MKCFWGIGASKFKSSWSCWDVFECFMISLSFQISLQMWMVIFSKRELQEARFGPIVLKTGLQSRLESRIESILSSISESMLKSFRNGVGAWPEASYFFVFFWWKIKHSNLGCKYGLREVLVWTCWPVTNSKTP